MLLIVYHNRVYSSLRLIFLPFRSSGLYWAEALLVSFPSSHYPLRQHRLATAEPGTHPQDHVETFTGNVDDNFRVGIKLTKKYATIFEDFY